MSAEIAVDPFSPIHRLSPRIASGDLTPLALTEACLARIEAHNRRLHAYIDVYADTARRAARAAGEMIAAGHYLGPLHGIPVALKDIIDWQGRITTGGSPAWRERRSPGTAAVVERLLAAGMIVLGKTHTVEFAFGGWGSNEHLGMPWNPWDPAVRRTPGGSSSGSAVAPAAALCSAALGTDTGGSVRLPAGFCGVVGLKTSEGLISTEGVLPLARSLDTVGPLARSVEDAALLFNALRGVAARGNGDALDPLPTLRAGVRGLRLAVLPTAERDGVDSEILARYDASLAVLEQRGATLVEQPLPEPFSVYRDTAATLMSAEGYSELQPLVDDPDRPMDRHVRARLRAGAALSAREFILAQRARDRMRCESAAVLDGIDALLTPTTAQPAVAADALDEALSPGLFTRAGNLLGWCGLSVPNGYTAGGLPTGLLINARARAEARALRIGWAYEQATAGERRRPPEPA